ncbi:hypothetical protein JCM10207_007287 [Rhodosporidiobolus poonsookiae]
MPPTPASSVFAAPPDFSLSSLSPTDLVDHLIVACEEHDALFVLFWLRALRDKGCLDWARDKHSWRDITAFEALAAAPPTHLRAILIELLRIAFTSAVHDLRDDRHAERQHAADMAVSMVGKASSETTAAEQAHALLAFEDDVELANWIDANLPPPPNPDKLTGYAPLPPRPRNDGPYLPFHSSFSGASSRAGPGIRKLARLEGDDQRLSTTLYPSFPSYPDPPHHSSAAARPHQPSPLLLRFSNLPPPCTIQALNAHLHALRLPYSAKLSPASADGTSNFCITLPDQTQREHFDAALEANHHAPAVAAGQLAPSTALGGDSSASASAAPVLPPPKTRQKRPLRHPAGPESPTLLFVGNLALTVTDSALAAVFSSTGCAVKSVKVASGWRKGFGFVECATTADRDKAMAELQGKKLEGQKLSLAVGIDTREGLDEGGSDEHDGPGRETKRARGA